ncbi:MAG: GNAT family N-acetyltransferase [Patescibacteria group bacterium]
MKYTIQVFTDQLSAQTAISGKVLDLFNRSFPKYAFKTEQGLISMLTGNLVCLVVIFDGDQLIGLINSSNYTRAARNATNELGYNTNVFGIFNHMVDESYRGLGLGAVLVKTLIEKLDVIDKQSSTQSLKFTLSLRPSVMRKGFDLAGVKYDESWSEKYYAFASSFAFCAKGLKGDSTALDGYTHMGRPIDEEIHFLIIPPA